MLPPWGVGYIKTKLIVVTEIDSCLLCDCVILWPILETALTGERNNTDLTGTIQLDKNMQTQKQAKKFF